MKTKKISTFQGIILHSIVGIMMYVVYYNPADFPCKYVVRLFDGDRPTPYATISDTLEQARETIPKKTFRMNRMQKDDPVIQEVWI